MEIFWLLFNPACGFQVTLQDWDGGFKTYHSYPSFSNNVFLWNYVPCCISRRSTQDALFNSCSRNYQELAKEEMSTCPDHPQWHGSRNFLVSSGRCSRGVSERCIGIILIPGISCCLFMLKLEVKKVQTSCLMECQRKVHLLLCNDLYIFLTKKLCIVTRFSFQQGHFPHPQRLEDRSSRKHSGSRLTWGNKDHIAFGERR